MVYVRFFQGFGVQGLGFSFGLKDNGETTGRKMEIGMEPGILGTERRVRLQAFNNSGQHQQNYHNLSSMDQKTI